MLQQTQVDTVIPYYEAFVERFGDVRALARGRADTVMKLWEGLGYYSRARHLHAAARMIVREHKGRFPSEFDAILGLPGVGRYTAGAIASMAFGQARAVVDGNVIRVLCRVFRIEENPKTAAVQRRLWSLAESLLPADRAGDFNQALMELGATVCFVKRPLCQACPLGDTCAARKADCQETLPAKAVRKAVPRRHIASAVIMHKGRILAGKRKAGGLLGDLWELPAIQTDAAAWTKTRLQKQLQEAFGIDAKVGRKLEEVTHVFSHFKLRAIPYLCMYVAGRCSCRQWSRWRWIPLDRVGRYAWSSGQKKLLERAAHAVGDQVAAARSSASTLRT